MTRYVVLKRGVTNAGTPFLYADSEFHERESDADIVLRRRRQDRDMARSAHQYALGTVEMPDEEAWG